MKPYRYEILDGLRGVAALMVVIFHLSEAFSYDPVYKHLNHGYLCVDFFYVLSGFVIGFAYQSKMKSGAMSQWQFLKTRFIRLQPMVLFGAVLGAGLFFFQECNYYAGIGNASVWYVIWNMLCSFFMIPVTPDLNVRANTEMFVLNIPQWSMFFEYIANILFCLFVYRLGKKGLMIIVALFGVTIVDSALSLNLFGLLEAHDYPCSLNAGWSLTLEQLYIGIARVGFSFFTGLLMFNLVHKASDVELKKTRMPIFAICSFIIIAIVCIDQIGGYEHPLYDGIFNLLCVAVICPFTVYLGSRRIELTERTKSVCDFLGRLSYPLYLAHYPLVYLFFTWMDTHHDESFAKLAFTSSSVFMLSIALGYAALKVWDEPVRKWLRNNL